MKAPLSLWSEEWSPHCFEPKRAQFFTQLILDSLEEILLRVPCHVVADAISRDFCHLLRAC